MIHTTTGGANLSQDIMIRGRNSITANNEPLIIVDGIPYDGEIHGYQPE